MLRIRLLFIFCMHTKLYFKNLQTHYETITANSLVFSDGRKSKKAARKNFFLPVFMAPKVKIV